jgi:hypothetical protein
VELLLLGLHTQVDLKLVLDYLSAYPHKVKGGPCKNIAIFVEERQELCMFFWTYLSVEADGSVRYPRAKCNFLEITLGFNGFFEFYRSFLLDGVFCLLILFCLFP